MKRNGARFVRFYPSDWRSGCIGLSFEQEGLYVRMCAYIYETGKRIPASDSAAARILGANTNAYRKVRDQLAALGKIITRDGEWTVDRAERELALATAAQEVGVATPRPVHGVEYQNGGDQVSGRDAGTDAVGDATHDTPTDTPPVQAEKTEQILRATKEPISNKQTNKPSLSVSGDLKAAFNGSTEAMLSDIAAWMQAERQYAEKWLRSLVSSHGAAKVLDAYRSVVQAQAKGRMVADPIRYFAKVAASSKAQVEAADKPMVPAHVVRYAKPKLDPQPWETK